MQNSKLKKKKKKKLLENMGENLSKLGFDDVCLIPYQKYDP